MDASAIIKEVKANSQRLLSCDRHQFDFPRTRTAWASMDGQRVTCVRCGGWLQRMQAIKYAEGYCAANGDPLDVLVDGFPLVGEFDAEASSGLNQKTGKPLEPDVITSGLNEEPDDERPREAGQRSID